MSRAWSIAFLVALVGCATRWVTHTGTPAEELAGTWVLEVDRPAAEPIRGTITLDAGPRGTGRYAIPEVAALDECMEPTGDVFSGSAPDSVTVWLSPMVSHCGIRLAGAVRHDSVVGWWCREVPAGPMCGTDPAAWRGSFTLVRTAR